MHFDASVGQEHDVFRLQVAMQDAVRVQEFEGVANGEGDGKGALWCELVFLVEQGAQQTPFHPLHRHVNAAAFSSGRTLTMEG